MSMTIPIDHQLEQQPRALKHLFLTEAWERFAYFAVQSILVLFMSKTLGYSDNQSYMIYSAFAALLFITPLAGGYLADRFLGYVHAIILGVTLLSVGYFLLATANPKLLLGALAILSVGNGLFKPNISTLLGCMYEPNAKSREAGFMIFYFGINIGATVGVILCGFVAKAASLSWAIAVAGAGLIVGGTVFLLSRTIIKRDVCCSTSALNKTANRTTIGSIYVGFALLLPLMWFLLKHTALVNLLVLGCAVLLLAYLSFVLVKSNSSERGKLLVCIVLIAFSIAFWALYQQSFMSVVMYLSRLVDLRVFGIELPPSVISSLNGICLIMLAPLVIKFWQKLRQRNKEPNVVVKFVLGIGLMGIGYFIIYFDTKAISSTVQFAPLGPIIFSYAIQTLGELFLSPVGLAMIAVLAPQRIRGLMMGVWFFALAAANILAGQLAHLTADAANLLKPAAAALYGHAFLIYGWLAFLVALLLLVSAKKLGELLVR